MSALLEQIPISPLVRDIIGAFVIILATLIAARVVKLLLALVVSQLTSRSKSDLDDRLMDAVSKWIYWLSYVLGFAVLFNYLEARLVDTVGDTFFRAIDGANYAAGVIIVAILLVRAISALLDWYRDTIAIRTATTVDDEFIPLVDRTVRIIFYSLALLIILDHFDIDIKGLIAVLGVGSLAVALAAQETLANMIAGFVIMLDRPFRVGDRVRISDGTLCVVHEIGIRSSKFRTFDNTLIIVPNSELTKSTIHNITYPHPQVRVRVDVGVSYDSDIGRVRDVMLLAAEEHPKVLDEPKPYFAFLSFGDSALDVALYCQVQRAEEQWRTGNELRETIFEGFRKEGIEIPFPQRVVTLLNPDEKK